MTTPYGDLPAPLLNYRFLYGKADDLNAWTDAAVAAKPLSSWRTFTDDEDDRMQAAWWELNVETREKALRLRASRIDTTKSTATQAEKEDVGIKEPNEPKDAERTALEQTYGNCDRRAPLNEVAVGIDNLFTADLLTLECIPSFWVSNHVPITIAGWFYAPSVPGKYQPVEYELAARLENKYNELGSWHPSYGDVSLACLLPLCISRTIADRN